MAFAGASCMSVHTQDKMWLSDTVTVLSLLTFPFFQIKRAFLGSATAAGVCVTEAAGSAGEASAVAEDLPKREGVPLESVTTGGRAIGKCYYQRA